MSTLSRGEDEARATATADEEPPDTGVRSGGAEQGGRHKLTAVQGLAALSLDAMASVAYGPEAVVLVLAAAGAHGLGFTLPVTLAIAGLLAVLVASYRQVIAAFPNGGGAYAVAKAHLGRRPALVAAASLILDYVLNVAASVTAGVAALTSAFPALYGDRVWICLAVLALVTAVNLRGIVESARLFIVPTVVFVGSILAIIAVGLFRSAPVSAATADGHASTLGHGATTVGALLLLKAFASGCSALTGVEAVANAVPSFRAPAARRAQRTEVTLGALLGVMLIGLSVLIGRFHLQPVEGVTVLAQLADASLGHNWAFYVVQFATMVLLALAANTSFGGLPVLMGLLARDNNLPHVFALKADRQVHRHGVLALAGASAVLLVTSGGDTNTLVPLFAIGVFVGFTLCQTGMVRHWRTERTPAGEAKPHSTVSVPCSPAWLLSWSPPPSSATAHGSSSSPCRCSSSPSSASTTPTARSAGPWNSGVSPTRRTRTTHSSSSLSPASPGSPARPWARPRPSATKSTPSPWSTPTPRTAGPRRHCAATGNCGTRARTSSPWNPPPDPWDARSPRMYANSPAGTRTPASRSSFPKPNPPTCGNASCRTSVAASSPTRCAATPTPSSAACGSG